MDKHRGAVPDPFGPIPDDHHHRSGAEPRNVRTAAQFPQLCIQQLCIQMTENGVGIAQTSDQEASHQRAASGRGFHALVRQQQDSRFDIPEMTLFHRRQSRQWNTRRRPVNDPSGSGAAGASWVGAPSLRLSA